MFPAINTGPWTKNASPELKKSEVISPTHVTSEQSRASPDNPNEYQKSLFGIQGFISRTKPVSKNLTSNALVDEQQ